MSARKSSAPNESLAVPTTVQAAAAADGGRAIRDVGQTSHTRETNAGRLSRSAAKRGVGRARATYGGSSLTRSAAASHEDEEFDFSETKAVSAPQLTELAEGGYIESSEPILFLGDCGTGKTHLMTGLCVACRNGGCASPRRRRWSTNSSKPSSKCS